MLIGARLFLDSSLSFGRATTVGPIRLSPCVIRCLLDAVERKDEPLIYHAWTI